MLTGRNTYIRTVIEAAGRTLEQNNYYPFGMLFGTCVGESNKQPYKFTGKEYITAKGYNIYDFGIRGLNPATGQWGTPDPLLEKYFSVSPYAYCFNNPVNVIDPDGRLPVFLVPIIKGAVGAIVDTGAQITVSMANNKSFSEALSEIDYSSVGAAFVTSAIATPGMSTSTKVITTGVITTDALVDVSNKRGAETVFNGKKSFTNAGIDEVSSVLPGKTVDCITSGFNKAISSDLSSSAAATLSKETKSSLMQTQSIVNSRGFQTATNATIDLVGGMISGQFNESMKNMPSTDTKVSVPKPKSEILIPDINKKYDYQ